MKSKLSILMTVVLSLTFVLPMKVFAFSDLGSICLYVAEDDKNRFRKMLKTSRSKVKNLYKEVKCNGKNLLQFAMERKASKVGIFMVKKISISLLKKEDDLAWAKENSLADSEIAQALVKRIGG